MFRLLSGYKLRDQLVNRKYQNRIKVNVFIKKFVDYNTRMIFKLRHDKIKLLIIINLKLHFSHSTTVVVMPI